MQNSHQGSKFQEDNVSCNY